MANNVTADPGTGGAVFKTTDNAGVHTPHSNIDTLPALPAGTNNIGDIDVLTVPADPFGVNADAASATGSISAKLRFIASTGIPITGSVAVTGPLTDAQLRAALVQVDGSGVTQPVSITGTPGSALGTVGGGTEAGVLRVTIANDSTGVLSVDDNGGSLTVDGTVTANAGTNLNTSALALEAGGNLAAQTTALQIMDDWDESDRAKVNLIVGQAGVAGGTGTVGATTLRTTLATDVNVPTKEIRSATATTSQVADSASSVTLLAANANRLGCSIQNDSSAVLYLKCGTTATSTDYTARLVQYAFWEPPAGTNYTGRIDGIWATDPGDGAARVTEYT